MLPEHGSITVSDDDIIRYVIGAASSEVRSRVEAACAVDPDIAAQVMLLDASAAPAGPILQDSGGIDNHLRRDSSNSHTPTPTATPLPHIPFPDKSRENEPAANATISR